ncbi:hypothetical protein J2Y45_005325 [Dyadobacter sp. BE34]|nr:hypothetical protein [Dyadobacter sp. BE242]MDR7200171.1 hypothetical protein [Dyadobacter sp. BE34]MDR7218131.1 hypothetical protein [Dyadobacter sp. BE31]MDR7266062.1 hypothetical protein [Dyadobacter sp. BE32]
MTMYATKAAPEGPPVYGNSRINPIRGPRRGSLFQYFKTRPLGNLS